MGSSIGDEELDQMVRDYYESSESNNIPPSQSQSHPPPPLHHQSILQLQDILSEATDFESEILEKVMDYITKMEQPNSLKLKLKWVLNRLQMDGYKACLCKLTSWVTSFGPAKDDHEYIEVMNKSTRLIVEMELKSQFKLARPTQRYKELISKVPSIFVGSEERLNKIISLLCSAAKDSLKEKGLHIPPWRTTEFMLSKWMSNNCNKISL